MLNEEKIKLMTKLAAYEQGEGKRELPMSRYFKSDYVGLNMIKTFIASTFAYILLLAVWIVYEMENVIENAATFDYVSAGYKIVILYVIFVVTYQVIARVVYGYKFKKARESLREYHAGLKKLESMILQEDRVREEIEIGGNNEYDDSFDD